MKKELIIVIIIVIAITILDTITHNYTKINFAKINEQLEQIKEISEDVVVTKAKLKKLIISHKVKRYNNWKKPFVKNNKKIKIYYRGKKIH